MIIIILIVGFIWYIYYNYPNNFVFNKQYVQGRYVTLSKKNNIPINYANIVFIDNNNNNIMPVQIIVNPKIRFGDGITPKAKNGDTQDVILLETTSGNFPYVEYDLGRLYNLNKIIITNRNRTIYNDKDNVDTRLLYTNIYVLNEDDNIVFNYYIDDVRDIYSINTY